MTSDFVFILSLKKREPGLFGMCSAQNTFVGEKSAFKKAEVKNIKDIKI